MGREELIEHWITLVSCVYRATIEKEKEIKMLRAKGGTAYEEAKLVATEIVDSFSEEELKELYG